MSDTDASTPAVPAEPPAAAPSQAPDNPAFNLPLSIFDEEVIAAREEAERLQLIEDEKLQKQRLAAVAAKLIDPVQDLPPEGISKTPLPPPPPLTPPAPNDTITALLSDQRRENSIPAWRVIEQELSVIRPGFVKDLRESFNSRILKYLQIRREQLIACGRALGNTACGESKAAVHAAHDKRIEDALSTLIRSTFVEPSQSTVDSIPPLYGLAFSGGGIRSATLSLGVLQTLARTGRLRRLDYLSTVSGGGYTGAWFKAWLYRLLNAGAEDPLQTALDELGKRPDTDPVQRLREYSNFLSPRLGAFSSDTWTLVALASRNLLLNWILFIPLGLLIVAVPWILLMLGAMANTWARHNAPVRWTFAGIGTAFFMFALGMTTKYVADTQLYKPTIPPGRSLPLPRGVSQMRFVLTCGAPLLLGTLLFAIASPEKYPDLTNIIYIFIGLAIAGAVSSALNAREQKFEWGLAGLLGGVVLAAGFVGSHALMVFAAEKIPSHAWLFGGLWLSVPLALLATALSATIYIGVSSKLKDATDILHEWWSRFGGWLLLIITAWLLGIIVTILLPMFLLQSDGWTEYLRKAVTAGGGLIGIATAAFGFFDTSSPATQQQKPSLTSRLRSLMLPLGAAIFAIAVFVGNSLLLLMIMHGARPSEAYSAVGAFRDDSFHWPSPFWNLLIASAALGALLAIAAKVINYARFTLHALYRERLVRAYLGASNTRRNPDIFTGFDPDDNIRLHEMRAYGIDAALDRPFHIMNMTLNLTNTTRLDWQERQGESFTASVLHAGTAALGYQDVRTYAGPPRFGDSGKVHTGLTLGGAVAASGAAASPNMGYNSSPLVAFLLTIFNVRLGVWLPNPGPDGKDVHTRSSPRWALEPAISELLGLSNDQSAFVNITDGGHFDNMGIYELIRRGVRIIVCIDGECDNVGKDTPFIHEGLAQAIRKCNIDFGVEIKSHINSECPAHSATAELSVTLPGTAGVKIPGNLTVTNQPHTDHAPDWDAVLCPKGYWLARIHYPGDAVLNNDGERASKEDKRPEPGYLLYIKPILFGDLPVDLRNYHASNPDFPQQTTADQWFSESQFESYRKLGAHLANEIPANVWKKIGL